MLKTFVFVLSLLTLFSPLVSFAQVRTITFPVNGTASFRDDFHEPRGVNGEREHIGNDIIAAKMTPVVSTVDGIVSYIVSPEASWGYSITIRDAEGYQYRYLHLNNDTPGTDDGKGGEAHAYVAGLERGSRVTAGQHIGWVGDSGNAESTVPHLHFEIRAPDRSPINPYQSLAAAAARSPNRGSINTGGTVHLTVDTGDTEQVVQAGAAYIFTVDMAEGARGQAVRELQAKLKAYGYFNEASVTDYYGPITKEAVRNFQLGARLGATGTLDMMTRAALNADSSVIPGSSALSEVLFEGSENEAVRLVQRKLSGLGYYKGSVTGYYDAVTREAVRAFQVAKGLAPSGTVEATTWTALTKPDVSAGAPATGNYTFTENLYEGMRGQAVRELQTKLKIFGHFRATVTDYFGPITRAAVVAFQTEQRLEATGIVGPQTRAALNAISSTGPRPPTVLTEDLREGMRGEQVRLLQTMLKGLGLYGNMTITDYYDSTVREAVRKFQNMNKLTPSGAVDFATRQALNAVH